MWPFGKKKKKDIEETPVPKPAEPEYTCLFCRKKFHANQIVFARTLRTPDAEFRDEIFDEKLSQYQRMNAATADGRQLGLSTVFRRMMDMNTCEVVAREKNGLPLAVRGKLKGRQHENMAQEDNLRFSEFGFSESYGSDVDEEEEVLAQERLCPYCHFTLPEGFATDRVIQVGLLGGSRSGKTTYMAVVTEYLKNKMGSLNTGLELAKVEILPECQKYQEALYYRQRETKGADTTPIVGEIRDQMIMPIIIHLTPLNDQYPPFFLVFQDIPGEYLIPNPQTRDLLTGSNIPRSNALIMLVDVNHFIYSLQHPRLEPGEREIDSEFGGYCKQDVNTLFNNLEYLSFVIPKGQLNSVQCVLTKLDFWIEEERDRIGDTLFVLPGDDAHRKEIDEDRLILVHDQIEAMLNGIGGEDQSGLLNALVKSMHLEDTKVHRSYSAVASRIVPGHEEQLRQNGADYQTSLNVLEPLMNIFAWEHVLPVKPSEYN